MLKKLKKYLMIVGIILLVILTIALIVTFNDNLRFKLDYESLNSIPYDNGKKIEVKISWNNPVDYIYQEEVIEVLENGTGIVYFGYNSCPWCRNIVEILLETAKEEKFDKVYYVNTHGALDGIEEELIEILHDYLRENPETGEKVLAVPDVYFIKDGKIIGHHISTVESYKNPYKGMNEEQKKELKKIYQELLEEIK